MGRTAGIASQLLALFSVSRSADETGGGPHHQSRAERRAADLRRLQDVRPQQEQLLRYHSHTLNKPIKATEAEKYTFKSSSCLNCELWESFLLKHTHTHSSRAAPLRPFPRPFRFIVPQFLRSISPLSRAELVDSHSSAWSLPACLQLSDWLPGSLKALVD